MKRLENDGQTVSAVDDGSIAQALGILPGDRLMEINGVAVLDVIDYEYLCAGEELTLEIVHKDGAGESIVLEKDADEPLGLSFDSGLMSPVRSCNNRCMFCFIDQMPKGVRKTLHFKDDDWRLSFIMGNYVTLTNVDDGEFERILQRRVSPLYVSVHTTDPQLRVSMMKNPTAGRILERLRLLKENGLRFHSQLVLCPQVNDGDALERTLTDLYALYPAAQSVAAVPVGLTRFRDGLAPLRPYTPSEAETVIDQAETFQRKYLQEIGSRFVFLSDEWYLLAGRELPSYEECEDFPQTENGVGLLRLYEHDFLEALSEKEPLPEPKRFTMAGGEAASAFFRRLYDNLTPYHAFIDLAPIHNDYFGGNVSVGGLVTGGDLVSQLKGHTLGKALLIPGNMLRQGEEVFLDGMTLSQAEEALGVRILPIQDGTELIETIFTEQCI